MGLTVDQWVKIILAVISLIGIIIGAIFAINKRNHKIGNITGHNNNIINGNYKSKN